MRSILLASLFLPALLHAQANKAWIPLQPLGPAKEPVAASPYIGKGGVPQTSNPESLESALNGSEAWQQQLRNVVAKKNAASTAKPVVPAPPTPTPVLAAAHYFIQGQRYWRGDFGYPSNQKLALDMLRLSVESEYPPALYQLGRLYQTGRGVLQDETLAAELQNRARSLGLAVYDAQQIDSDTLY